MPSTSRVQLIEQKTLWKGFFEVKGFRLQFGQPGGVMSDPVDRAVFVRHDAVMVIPLDAKLQKVAMVEQFRAGAFANPARRDDPWLYEFPAGMIEPGQAAADAARREVMEETGLEVQQLRHLSTFFTSPGGCSERISLYLANVELGGQQGGPGFGLASEQEDIYMHILPVAGLAPLVGSRRIADAASLLAVSWLQLHLPNAFSSLTKD